MSKKNLLKKSCVVLLAFLLISWGYNGHYKISFEASQSFNQEMGEFVNWASTLAAHASDADERKEVDPTEGPKHYIDIDNYPEFVQSGKIPHTLDSVISIHGEDFVYDQGILPWATLATYDSLVQCFLRFDWYKAVLFASDLGHYVADGHMPLHITRNYNGQYTGNTGIHSRYESTMINTYLNQISYPGDTIEFVEDVRHYVFSYLYANYHYVDSVLLADTYAQGVAGNTSSFAYREALWSKTKNFTVPLFAQASNTLAELIYSAWTEAGKPPFNSSGLKEEMFRHSAFVHQNYPNPFSGLTSFTINLATDSQISLRIVDINGKAISMLADGFYPRGEYHFDWDATDVPAGIYFILLESDRYPGSVMKVIVGSR
jgi:hypothetical protein